MQVEVWHINGVSFHLGRHGLGQEESSFHLSSDTLWSALIARLAELRTVNEVGTFIARMRSATPPFVISSAFPRAGPVLFFAKPLAQSADELPSDVKPKVLKKVRFVSQKIFDALLKGEVLASFSEQAIKLNNGQAWALPEESLPGCVIEDEKLWSIERRPRVAVGRADNQSQIYFTGHTVFHQDCGLWSSIRWLGGNKNDHDLMELLLHDLSVAGLGGERSSGFGRCEITKRPEVLIFTEPKDDWLTLSRYLPKADEMGGFAGHAAYEIDSVGGWIYSAAEKNQRRKTVSMLREGSVLSQITREVPGQIAEVTPDYGSNRQTMSHPVWRCGLALAVGITLNH